MNRGSARAIHSVTNMAYWIENPDWCTGNAVANSALKAVRSLPIKLHEPLRNYFFNTQKLIAVNGESVVVESGPDKVDKFMFRYPSKMALEAFHGHVEAEVGAVTQHLAGVALPTSVSVKPALIFRNPRSQVEAVAQTQTKLDLEAHTVLEPETLQSLPTGAVSDKVAHDLDTLVTGTERLVDEHGFYPDIAGSGGNLRVNLFDGAVTLVDVMPFYENGSRLIGDRPPNVIDHLQGNLALYQDFAGQYGG